MDLGKLKRKSFYDNLKKETEEGMGQNALQLLNAKGEELAQREQTLRAGFSVIFDTVGLEGRSLMHQRTPSIKLAYSENGGWLTAWLHRCSAPAAPVDGRITTFFEDGRSGVVGYEEIDLYVVTNSLPYDEQWAKETEAWSRVAGANYDGPAHDLRKQEKAIAQAEATRLMIWDALQNPTINSGR